MSRWWLPEQRTCTLLGRLLQPIVDQGHHEPNNSKQSTTDVDFPVNDISHPTAFKEQNISSNNDEPKPPRYQYQLARFSGTPTLPLSTEPTNPVEVSIVPNKDLYWAGQCSASVNDRICCFQVAKMPFVLRGRPE